MTQRPLPCSRRSPPFKWARLAIPDSTTLVQPNYETCILLCSYILAALKGADVFRSTYHLMVIWEVKAKLKPCNAVKNESCLNGLVSKMSYNNCRIILKGKGTGQWLSVLPSAVNRT
jgi:hypothetical protein